jgi:hypothetical protein
MQRAVSHSFACLVGILVGCAGEDPPPGGPGLRGRLIDANEQPLVGVEVLACQATSCAYGESGPDGWFEFTIEAPAKVALKTHPLLASNPRMAAALEPVEIVDDSLVDVGTLWVPDLPNGAAIDPAGEEAQVLAVGDGLELTLTGADVTPPIGVFLDDVAARRLPSEHVPPYPALEGAQVVAVYALHPFGSTCDSAISVRVPVELADGSDVRFHTVDELDGEFWETVPGRVEQGHAITDPGTGITKITYLVISR